MDTATLLRWVATHEPGKKEEAFASLTTGDSHYPALLRSLGIVGEMPLTFWALSLLVQYFPALLQRDANQAIPLVMACLVRGDGPVCDRAAWALSIMGEPALDALVLNIQTTPDTADTVRYIGALRSNSSLYAAAGQVMALLAAKLDSPCEEVQFWALVVLMDIGPLRPWFDKRLKESDFEQIYDRLLTVAKRLAPQKQFDFALTYIELLEKRLAK